MRASTTLPISLSKEGDREGLEDWKAGRLKGACAAEPLLQNVGPPSYMLSSINSTDVQTSRAVFHH